MSFSFLEYASIHNVKSHIIKCTQNVIHIVACNDPKQAPQIMKLKDHEN